MDCHTVSKLLSADLDGELSAAESAQVAAHVATCADCARKKQVLEQTWGEVLRLGLERVATGFDDGVARRIHSQRRTHAGLAAAAAVIVVGVLGVLLLREPGTESPDAAGTPTPRVAAVEPPDPGVGLDCGLPGARVCVADGAVVVLAQPHVAFTE